MIKIMRKNNISISDEIIDIIEKDDYRYEIFANFRQSGVAAGVLGQKPQRFKLIMT